ncbi:MAG: helix-turn-helix transcriptional regulator [Fimbriimonadaceae bacterium]|nr:MAG: helix-turn-helix transcriptional regulator [Fimbriimonadaceae bacterium]
MPKLYPGQVELLVFDNHQIRALASVACTEVFSTISAKEPISIREIAQELGKSPASVGEHVSTLLAVELIVPAGTRKRRSRTEALYIAKGRETKMVLRGKPWGIIMEYLARFRGQMRMAERQFELTQKAAQIEPGINDYLQYRWSRAYLSRENSAIVRKALHEVYDLIDELSESDQEKRIEGEHIHVNVSTLMIPTQSESKRILKSKAKED